VLHAILGSENFFIVFIEMKTMKNSVGQETYPYLEASSRVTVIKFI